MSNFFTETRLNFKKINKIGNGGFGDVYKVMDLQLNAIIAVKYIPVNGFIKESEFFQETKKLYLSRHANVVNVLYGCKDDDYIYIAMPLYPNGSLKGKVDERFVSSQNLVATIKKM